MSTNNMCFCGEVRKILCGYSLLSRTTDQTAPSGAVVWVKIICLRVSLSAYLG